jgi:hypothetical protein
MAGWRFVSKKGRILLANPDFSSNRSLRRI